MQWMQGAAKTMDARKKAASGLKIIRLELARHPDFPEGSASRGYEIHAPLTADGHLDVDAWHKASKQCAVRRFWPGEPDRVGELHHTRHRTWAFSYAPGEEDDEALYRLEGHVFAPGEYVTITEPGGLPHTFRVMFVR
jgi:hypothetical protein